MTNARPISRGTIAALLMLSMAFGLAEGQSLVTPTSHWGGNTLPDLQDRAEYGIHFVGFTVYGKEIHPCPTPAPCPSQYWFTPYNDMRETLGFNMLAYSRMKNGIRMGLGRDAKGVDPGPLSRRRTIAFGLIDDHATEFFQNRVIHLANWRHTKLRRVPRDSGDTPTRTSYGPTHAWPPVLSLSEEYFLRLFVPRRVGGDEERWPSPFFFGGGWELGTVNQELFIHAGGNVYEWALPGWAHLGGFRLNSAGVGGMARAGLLKPGQYFPDLTSHYTDVQAVGRLNFEWWGYGTQLEYALTSSSGFFVAPRTPAQQQMIGEFPRNTDTASVYQAKSGLNEFFSSIRVRIGQFTFETYNDSQGGKDKGPSFGAHMSYNVYRPDRRFPWVGGVARRRHPGAGASRVQ